MSEKYIGCTISLSVAGGLGYYQGVVSGVNTKLQTITLKKVIHNGKPYETPEVTFSAGHILELELLKPKEKDKLEEKSVEESKVELTHTVSQSSPVGFKPLKPKGSPKNKMQNKGRRSVGEALAHGSNTYSSEYGARIDHQFRRSDQRNMNRKQQMRFRDDDTFGTPLNEDLFNTEFDFEKNLALFDKQAVMDEISNSRPDLVRQTDKNYKCDENVLPNPESKKKRQIIVPAAYSGEIVYTTDNGMLVPSVTPKLRVNLLSSANQHGLTYSRQLEMIGRGATELIISSIGGSHRLDPENSHQPPTVVLMCGLHKQGAAGANCARQLESHGVRTYLLLPPVNTNQCFLLEQELHVYSLTLGKTVHKVDNLPRTIDLIVDARYDLDGELGTEITLWASSISTWASSCRAPVLALDPPSDIIKVPFPLQTRLKLCPALPLTYLPNKGKVYLINLNIPYQVFEELEIKYTPLFTSKMAIPLHPCE